MLIKLNLSKICLIVIFFLSNNTVPKNSPFEVSKREF